MPAPVSRLDVRLVPAAVAAWTVTAAGIVWGVGPLLALLAAAGGLCWLLACHLLRNRFPLLRTTAVGVLGVVMVGVGFGIAVGMRTDAVRQHPLAARVGATAWVTVSPVDNPRQSGSGRLMFRGDLHRVDERETRGAVVVFAPAIDFGQLSAGQPVRFRARIEIGRASCRERV